ncbi:hypothetical protein EBO34_20130 [Alteribacter keqinensis]|uniref:Uncharacterized protein n=1 Tax=Alteribacter keqinensis TaxID=2483800 RepID=A0A3M7TLA6_9BACI|nr:hypothetical protein EBO34_20130 [Alteribacter keqinensis]
MTRSFAANFLRTLFFFPNAVNYGHKQEDHVEWFSDFLYKSLSFSKISTLFIYIKFREVITIFAVLFRKR